MNPYLLQSLLQMINHLMANTGVAPPFVQMVNHLLNPQNPDPGVLSSLSSTIRPYIGPQGIHQESAQPVVVAWLNKLLSELRQRQMMQQQPAMGYGGGYHPPMYGPVAGYGNANLMTGYQQPASPTSYFDDGMPNTPAYDPYGDTTQMQPTQPTQPSQYEYVDPLKAAEAAKTALAGFTDLFHLTPVPKEECDRISKRISLNEYLEYRPETGSRISIMSVALKEAVNNSIDAFKTAYLHTPRDAYQGQWIHMITYNELHRIPIATATFLTIRKKVAKAYNEGGWRAAIVALGEGTRNDFIAIDRLLTDMFNAMSLTLLRSYEFYNYTIHIDSIDDFKDLYDPNSSIRFARMPGYREVLDTIIASIFHSVFIYDEVASDSAKSRDPVSVVVKENDRNLGDIIRCNDIVYDNPTFSHISKYDYGTLEKTDRDTMIREILGKNTVIRVPNSVTVVSLYSETDLIALKAAEGISGHDIAFLRAMDKTHPSIISPKSTTILIVKDSENPGRDMRAYALAFSIERLSGKEVPFHIVPTNDPQCW